MKKPAKYITKRKLGFPYCPTFVRKLRCGCEKENLAKEYTPDPYKKHHFFFLGGGGDPLRFLFSIYIYIYLENIYISIRRPKFEPLISICPERVGFLWAFFPLRFRWRGGMEGVGFKFVLAFSKI